MKHILVVAAIFCCPFGASGQTVHFLGDIHQPVPHPFEHISGDFYAVNGQVLFFGLILELGYGIWAFDGNELSKISDTGRFSTAPAETSDGFFFLSEYDVTKYSLYKHGGTPGVTLLIDDVKFNSQTSVPSIASVNGKAFYPDWQSDTGYELWCAGDSAGSAALVKDGNPGAGNTFPTELTAANHWVYYRGGGTQGRQLWRSDGTEAGTVLLLQLDPSLYFQSNSLRTLGDKAYFLARKLSGETELWISDGTVAGTAKALDVPPCYASPDRFEAFFLDEKYIYLTDNGQNLVQGWAVTDGTAAGTETLNNFPVNTTFVWSFYRSNTHKSILNGDFYFFCKNALLDEFELWKSNGTSSGTEKVTSLEMVNPPQGIAATQQAFFFLLQTEETLEIELWSSDGSANATQRVKSLGVFDQALYYAIGHATDSTVLFERPFLAPFTPEIPYRSDGTEAGTYPALGKLAPYLAGSEPSGFVTGPNDEVFFRANDHQTIGFWQTSPTVLPAISRVDTLQTIDYQLLTGPMAVPGKVLWFPAMQTLRSMDETGAITDIPLPVTFSGEWANQTNGNVLFLANHGQSLWHTDGTLSGTYEVSSAPNNSVFYGLKYIGDSIYFLERIQLPNQPQHVWSSDGTAAGTQPIETVENSGTLFLKSVEGRLAYSKSQLTPNGRTLFVHGYPNVFFEGIFDGDFAGLSIVNNQLVVLGSKTYHPTNGVQYPLWVIENGTPQVLRNFASIVAPGYLDQYFTPPGLSKLNGNALFSAGLTTDNVELWHTDGTDNGTYELRDINPVGSSSPSNFVRYSPNLYLFTANDGVDMAWWATDGTWAGTFKVMPLANNQDYFLPTVREAYLTDNRLYFSLNDGTTGQEPWVMIFDDSLMVSTLSPVAEQNDLRLWPNPASDVLHIQWQQNQPVSANLEVFDAAGRLCHQEKIPLTPGVALDFRLPPSVRANGLYTFSISTPGGKRWAKNILVQK